MSLYVRIMSLVLVFGCLSFSGLRADSFGLSSVDELQSQVVAQMKKCDELIAQKSTAEVELVRCQKNNVPTTQAQLAIDALSKLLATAQEKLHDLQNKMHVMQAQPQP